MQCSSDPGSTSSSVVLGDPGSTASSVALKRHWSLGNRRFFNYCLKIPATVECVSRPPPPPPPHPLLSEFLSSPPPLPLPPPSPRPTPIPLISCPVQSTLLFSPELSGLVEVSEDDVASLRVRRDHARNVFVRARLVPRTPVGCYVIVPCTILLF